MRQEAEFFPVAARSFCLPVGRILNGHAPRTDWLVESLLEKGAIGFIGGEPKLGKSWLALHLALCLSAGTPFLGHFRVPRKRRVLYIQEEDSRALVQRRLRRLMRGGGIRSIADGRLHCAIRSGFRIDWEPWRLRLEGELSAFKPDAVIVDVFNKIHTKEENSQPEMTEVRGRFEKLRRSFGCSWLIVHHFRKAGGLGASRRGNQSLRGSSVLGGWSEDSLYISGKAGELYRIDPESKSSDAPPFLFALEDVRKNGRLWANRLLYQGEAVGYRRKREPGRAALRSRRGSSGRLPLFRRQQVSALRRSRSTPPAARAVSHR